MTDQTAPAKGKPAPSTYIIIIIGLSLLGVTAVVFVSVLRPTGDNSLLINTILAFLTPTIGAILALMIKDIHTDINSRMTELLNLTQIAAKAEGKLEGKIEKKAIVGTITPVAEPIIELKNVDIIPADRSADK